jgi:uncharacterized membrane-anchored protein YjiN (DUF445 family)
VTSRRGLASAVLVGAAVVAVAAFPFRATLWGGWILAIAEAGIVGGLADWFAVTALFRRPLGLPIPHTGLIPANWEMLASRVGTMVGDRVLTRDYLAHELSRLDVADLLARAADRITRADIEAATRGVLDWLARQVPAGTAGDLVARLQRLLAGHPAAPALATALDLARQHGWDQRAVAAAARALAAALERPDVQAAVAGIVDDMLERYQQRRPLSRVAFMLAGLFGVVDRDRIVQSLRTGLTEVAVDADHPLRRAALEQIAALVERLRTDPDVTGRVERWKADLLDSPVVVRLVEDAAAALRRALVEDLARPDSDVVAWVADRLERWRRVLAGDARLREEVDRWLRARALEALDRHHGRIAGFIEKGVHALGPEGAVRLIEEHAGDDLQFIRVNGTVVGGIAGGAIYGLKLAIERMG